MSDWAWWIFFTFSYYPLTQGRQSLVGMQRADSQDGHNCEKTVDPPIFGCVDFVPTATMQTF
jgi:hypothetical protein